MSGEPLSPAVFLYHPNLADDHSVTSESTSTYNCYSWAISDKSLWRWPDPGELDSFWYDGLPRDDSLPTILAGLALEGFEESPDKGAFDPLYEKVVVFAKQGEPTHLCRQLWNGKWISKLGILQDIEHKSLEAVTDQKYGAPHTYLRRRRHAD